MKYLLDTSALLAHARREPEGSRVQDLFARDDTEILLCSVSLAEMARRLRELGVTEQLIWQIIADYEDLAAEIVPVNAKVARMADQMTRKAGERLPLADALIAAAAGSRGAVLVHRDAHMRSIPESELAQLDLAESTND
jgi:predicted nucleic acid-binding protein